MSNFIVSPSEQSPPAAWHVECFLCDEHALLPAMPVLTGEIYSENKYILGKRNYFDYF